MTLPRALIFIVAYEAECHIESVLNRIPAAILNAPHVGVLLIDDASNDATADVAARWGDARALENFTVLRNPANLGYGGNQKLGYRWAVDAGYDHVVLLHGDGQYAPEELPRVLAALVKEDADVLLCTRMHSIASARRGGMPSYKIAGNVLLTWIQNKLTGKSLSEYHTGYRAYSTRFLKSVPFEINTDAFHFDTEILLQAFRAQARVVEIPIKTHYGNEVCRVNSMRYARDVIRTTLRFACHDLGLGSSLKFRVARLQSYADKTAIGGSSHDVALDVLQSIGPGSVLDLGCGPGFVARAIAERTGANVTSVDTVEPQVPLPHHVRFDLESGPLPIDPTNFDAITLLDVIEHLSHPEEFLLRLRSSQAPSAAAGKVPWLLISTPNVAFIATRLGMLLGRFPYAERGILDLTHRRLFTRSSFMDMLEECGFDVLRLVPIGVPFRAVSKSPVGRALDVFSTRLARVWPGMFAFQFLAVCKPRPGSRELLKMAVPIRSNTMCLAAEPEPAK